MAYTLEYAQFNRGKFVAWIDAGQFQTKEEVMRCINARGCGEYLVSKDGKLCVKIFFPAAFERQY